MGLFADLEYNKCCKAKVNTAGDQSQMSHLLNTVKFQKPQKSLAGGNSRNIVFCLFLFYGNTIWGSSWGTYN